ncbi:hypothetical protein THAOC_17091, partial [Thalassiosira oceanica]
FEEEIAAHITRQANNDKGASLCKLCLKQAFFTLDSFQQLEKLASDSIQASALEESKTKARLDELELFTPCAFFRTPLLFVRLFVCLFVCLCFAPQKSGPPNKTLPFYLQRTFKLLAAASGSGLTAKQGSSPRAQAKNSGVWQKKVVVNGNSFHWSLTAAIDNDQSFCKEQMCLGSFALRELLDGTMDFALLPEYFGGSFDRDYAEKLVVEAFEEDKTRV